jgi:plastocyanin
LHSFAGILTVSFRYPMAALLSPRLVRLALALALLVTLVGAAVRSHQSATPVQAAQTWEVQVGYDDMQSLISTQAYFPNPLTVNAGVTVVWRFAGFHTVTFYGNETPLPLIGPGPNSGELALGPAFFPMGPQGSNATYDGTGRASSGTPPEGGPQDQPFTYSLTFTKPGLYGYMCTLHPGMRGEVLVQPAGAPLPETPAQAKARGQATIGALVGMMRSGLEGMRPTSLGSVHLTYAGLGDAFGVSALRFMPGDVTVRRGETVIWGFADPFEIHTVTFTSGQPDPAFIDVRPQPQGPPILAIPANVAGPVGGTTYTGQGYVNSGILAYGGSYALAFDAPPGQYEYLCSVHPFMRGTVTVTE